MITNFQLMALKAQAKGERIIYINIKDREFVFKSLGVAEYIEIMELGLNGKDFEDVVCQTALIYPDEGVSFGEYPLAGVSEIACKEILSNSGFVGMDNVREILFEKRYEMNIFHNQCVNTVKAAFPELALEEIQNYSWIKLMDLFARAERILVLRGNANFEIIDVSGYNEENEEGSESNELEDVEEKVPTIQECLENGFDPMLYFARDLFNSEGKDIVDRPFIGGLHWKREDVMNAISKQL